MRTRTPTSPRWTRRRPRTADRRAPDHVPPGPPATRSTVHGSPTPWTASTSRSSTSARRPCRDSPRSRSSTSRSPCRTSPTRPRTSPRCSRRLRAPGTRARHRLVRTPERDAHVHVYEHGARARRLPAAPRPAPPRRHRPAAVRGHQACADGAVVGRHERLRRREDRRDHGHPARAPPRSCASVRCGRRTPLRGRPCTPATARSTDCRRTPRPSGPPGSGCRRVHTG